MKNKKQMIITMIISVMIIITSVISLIINKKQSVHTAKLDAETLRTMQYEQLEESKMFADNCEYVKFGAFFTKNLDDDEEAERILGSCNKIGNSDTLYMDLNILSNGYLKDGKITIGSKNFTYKMQMVKDSVLKKDYVSNNVKEIELNTVNSGTQKLIMGTIHSSISGKNSYTQVNTITLTGTHVADDGTETPIKKTIDLTIDWYGSASASLTGLTTDYEPTDFSNAEDVTVKFSFEMKEKNKQLITSKSVMQVTIPDLLGFNPIAAECNISTSEYNYDSENKILYIENNSRANDCTYNVTVTYPKEAAEALVARFNEENLVRITAKATGYFECYNNENMQFENPYVTNTASSTASVTIQVKGDEEASHLVNVSILNTSYILYPTEGQVMSKEKLLEAYDSEEEIDVTYTVEWSVYRQNVTPGPTTLVLKDRFEDGDLFDNEYIEEYVSNIGLYFNQTALIPYEGTIRIYNDQTNELVKELKNGEWKNYNIINPLYFDEPINDIRIETTEDRQAKEYFNIYNIRKIDIKKLKEKYTREQVEDISKLKTHLIVSGSNLINSFTVKDEVNLVVAKSYNEISIDPTYIATSEISPIDATIGISVPTHNASCAEWKNGIFLVEMPSKIIYMDLENVTANKVTIDGYELYKKDNRYYIKIVTSNENPTSGFYITLKSKILADPMSETTYEKIKLYSYNEHCKMYYDSTQDGLDINGNEDKAEVIRVTYAGFQISAPSSFVTVETVSNYNDKGEITIAPNIAEVTRGTREATINVDFANNYQENVSNVEVLGKIPFKGNTYINGNSLNSEYSVKMTENGIKVPDELKDIAKVYYSEKENPTKDLEDSSNGWKLKENVSSFENIKTYLIVINNYDLIRGRKYSFNYTVSIPQDVTFNKASYACHTVYFKINTAGGTLESSVQPNKVGIRIVRYFDFDSLKYKEGTTLAVAGAVYMIYEIDEEENEVNGRIIRSTLEGKLFLDNLRVNQVYTFKEIQAPENYELNSEIIKFKVIENSNKELEFVLLSNSGFDGDVKLEKDENGKDVLSTVVYDLPKLSLNINKIDKDTKAPIQGVIFEIDGKRYVTDTKGQVKIENLSIGKEYILKEIYADGYYSRNPITFSVSKNSSNEFVITSDDELFNNSKITNDDKNPLIQLNATIENEKIPTYNLQIIKVDEENKESKLEGARFLLEKEDDGNSIYYTTNKDGIIDIAKLYQYVEGKDLTGKYTLQEVESPNGYITNKEKIVFVVSKDEEGKLQMNIENEDSLETIRNIESDTETVKLTIQNKPMFKITKVDSETKEPLANAEFIIYELKEDGTILDFAKNVDGEYVGTRNKDGNYVVVSDENGVITAALGNGSYKLVEAKAPNGYDQNLGAEIFTITGNKDVVSEDYEDLYSNEKQILEIDSIEDLVEFSTNVNNGNNYSDTIVKLTRTLDFNEDSSYENVENKAALIDKNGKGFTPIGNTNSNAFSGEFDGQEFEIRNLYINTDLNSAGLFGNINAATIKNLGITGEIIVNSTNSVYAAGLVAHAGYSVIKNCYNKANITATGMHASAAGIAASGSYTTILYCYNKGEIKAIATSYSAKAIGIGPENIYHSYNTGNITSIGQNSASAYGIGGTVKNSYNTGNIIAKTTQGNAKVSPINSYSAQNSYNLDVAEIVGTEEGYIYYKNKTSEYMKTEDFVKDLGSEFWSLDINNENNGYPILKKENKNPRTIEINTIEDLLSLSNDFYADYTDIIITLKRTLDFNDDNSYLAPNDNQGFGDINGDGKETGIKDELTNVEGKGFRPIGSTSIGFNGTFDGKGNEIRNIYINNQNYSSLFGNVTNCKIINLGITGNIKGNTSYVAGIAGTARGKVHIENCYNKCESISGDCYLGGLIGYYSGSELYIKSCNNYAYITGESDIGGILGSPSSSGTVVIYNCNNYGNINSTYDDGAGIIGSSWDTKELNIVKCNNEGNITGNTGMGGIIADTSGEGILQIKECSNKGDINISDNICGGIIGSTADDDNITILSCYNTGNIKASTYAGGIIGWSHGKALIENSYNSGNIETNGSYPYAGGIVSYIDEKTEIKSCYNTGSINATESIAYAYIGGITGETGYSNTVYISDCYNIGKIKVDCPGNAYVGGIVGDSSNSSDNILNCFNTGDIEVNSEYVYVGGIVGCCNGNITNTYNLGNITATANYSFCAGGIAGSCSGQNILQSYNNGNITVTNTYAYRNYSGGICGSFSGTLVKYCYNTGNIISNLKNTSSSNTFISGIVNGGETSFCYNIGNIKNTADLITGMDTKIAGINSTGNVSNCYNKGNIENTITLPVSSYNVAVSVGGIGCGTVSSSYNIGSVYNNVVGTANKLEIYTGAVVGNSENITGNNYYSSDIDVIGPNIITHNQTKVADEYMKTEEFFNKLSLENEEWKYIKNNYPELDIPILTKTEKSFTEITVENIKSNYEITTEIMPDENGEYNGGTISGEYTERYNSSQYKKLVETLKYGQNSTKEIVITPNEGYQIARVAINGEQFTFEANENGSIVIPVGYFENVDKDYNVAVTFVLKENIITINKVDENGQPLEGAMFDIHQVETRPEISDELGSFKSTSSSYNYEDTSKIANDLMGEFTNNGRYYFEKQDDGSYVSNNKGILNSIAESYVKIDLTEKTGLYYIVADVTMYGSGVAKSIAAVTSDTTPITGRTNGFINETKSKEGRYVYKINGGQVYYLHFAYIKNYTTIYTQDIFRINSLNLYEEKVSKFEFEQAGEKYVSKYTKSLTINTEANGNIPINLNDKTGKYKLTINAEMTGNTDQRGYIYIDRSGSQKTLIDIKGENLSKEYTMILDAGYNYTLYMAHSNNVGTGENINNVFTINSIKLELYNDGYYHETNAKTDANGQILRTFKYGTYEITETKAPDGYILNKNPVRFVVGDNTEKEITIVNESEKTVTAHYYLKGTGPEFDNEPVKVADDIVIPYAKGEEYTTTPQITIDKYTLIKDENGEYIIPENASGYVGDEDIHVYYYYEETTYKYIVNYFYNGVKDETKTVTGMATPNTVISEYEEKLKEGYALDKVENFPLTIGVDEDENIINVYYVTMLNITTDIIKHDENYSDGTVQKDVAGGFVTGADSEEPVEVVQIGENSTKEIKIDPDDGYDIVKILINNKEFDFSEKLDSDGNVIFEAGYFRKMTESKHIKVEFRKTTNVIVKYLEKDTEKVVAEEETISGYEGEYFNTVSKEVDGYHKATPEITNKDKVEIKPDGNMFADTLTVIYWYEADESQIIERFIEVKKDGTTKEMESEKHTGAVNTEFTSTRKEYDLYKSVDGPESSNSNVYVAGKDENSKTVKFEANKVKEIWYYYTKKTSDLTVEYVDNITYEPISPTVTYTEVVGTRYPDVRRKFEGYKLDEERLPDNENGHFTEDGDTIRYYYIKLKQYELEVVYTVESVPVNDVRINIEGTNGVKVNDYPTNGSLHVDKIESTDIGTEKYTLYEVETPKVYKQVLSEEKPGEVTITKRFNEELRSYEVVAECSNIEGVRTVVDHDNNKVTIYIETISKYDLSIKKFISKIDDVNVEGRAPVITLDNNGKPIYKMNDKIEEVSNNQNITYTIRMYNESEITAKGKRVIEYIPDGLVFMPENETNIKYQWVMFGYDENNELVITQDVNKAIIVVTDYLVNKEIEAFDRQSIPNSLDVEAVFKVDETKLTSEDRIIENKVKIMPNENDDYPENDECTEKVYVKYFDLSIEKYIEQVVVEYKGEVTTYKYGNNQNGNPVKIDIKKSKVNDTVLTITYGLLIKNVGQIPGYATEIVDYTPENFELVDDGKWIIDGKIAKSASLSNVLLQPGESTVLEVTYVWRLSETNVGTRINEAEITEYANEFNAADITDDNKDNEVLIVSIKTGLDEVAYIVIPVMGAMVIIAAGVVVIKKKYSKMA